MTRNAKKAFNALKKLGAPVFDTESKYAHYRPAEFVILDACEDSWKFVNSSPERFDTWYNGTYSDEVADILEKNNLCPEWENCEVLAIYAD